jgi:hypothetical protein
LIVFDKLFRATKLKKMCVEEVMIFHTLLYVAGRRELSHLKWHLREFYFAVPSFIELAHA